MRSGPIPLWSRWLLLLLAIGALGGCLAIDVALLRIGLDDLDEGYFAEQAVRVLHGNLPYRDFESLYTPGLLYLHAWLFAATGGPSIVGPRVASLVARALLAVTMYASARTLVPPAWAVWPPLLLLVGLDTIPAGWEPHPGWYAALTALLAVLTLARVPAADPRHRPAWLAAAGMAAAFTYLFKQNVGVLIALAVVAFILLQGLDARHAAVTPALRGLQLATAAAVIGMVVWLVHPFLDPGVAVFIVSPVLVAGAVLLNTTAVDNQGDGVSARLRALLPFGIGFALVTACWLGILLVSLDFQVWQLRAFVGAVDQGALYSPLQGPGAVALATLGPLVLTLMAIRARGWPRLVLLLAVGAGVALTAWGTRQPHEPVAASMLLAPERLTFGVISVLPAAAAWSTAWLARAQPTSLAEWRLRWYLTAGSFALLSQYPRMDTSHLAWSAPLLLVVGIQCIADGHTWLTRQWTTGPGRSVAIAVGLLSVPLLAAAPAIYLRAGVLFESDPETGLPTRAWLEPMTRPAMLDGFRLEAAAAWQLRDLLASLARSTPPGEPIFVYPSSPLLYVLADRPNATRYSHVYPDMPVDEQQRLVETLDRGSVQTVVISDSWLDFWGPTLRTGPVPAYIDSHFQEVARYGVFRELTRRATRPAA
ncbi:MAG: hypothetical protein LC797_02195 [Chloroflexi bacterium]|nr:hypothetical protein [Chloroflexota bacterium]